MNATEQQLRNEMETLQKLLNTQLTKVAALEDENRSLREYSQRIAQLEETNRLLTEQLAGEVSKSNKLKEKLDEKKTQFIILLYQLKFLYQKKVYLETTLLI